MTGRTNVCSGAITQLGFHTFLSPHIPDLRPLIFPSPVVFVLPLCSYLLFLPLFHLLSILPFFLIAVSSALHRQTTDNVDLITPDCFIFHKTWVLQQSCVCVCVGVLYSRHTLLQRSSALGLMQVILLHIPINLSLFSVSVSHTPLKYSPTAPDLSIK